MICTKFFSCMLHILPIVAGHMIIQCIEKNVYIHEILVW